jgi:ABC-type uncharacterized transport system permease subunit
MSKIPNQNNLSLSLSVSERMENMWEAFLGGFLRYRGQLLPVLCAALGLGAGLLLTFFAGENPWEVLKILTKSSFGTQYDLGMTLFYASCLVLTGQAVMLGLQGGLFNIGAEGQLLMGALAAAVVGISFPELPRFWAIILGIVSAFGAGFLWAGIAGALRAWRGCHEVISTIMLNFCAAGICNYFTLYWFKNPDSQNPETALVAPQYLIQQIPFFDGAPLSWAALLGPVMAIILGWFLWHTKSGLNLRAVGLNEVAAKTAGIKVKWAQFLSFSVGGGIAGLVGVIEVMGNAGKFKIGFSPGLGFMGLAVSLLGKNRPFGVLVSALLFGALHKGSLDLDFETESVTRELSQVLQALIILSVALGAYIDHRLSQRPRVKKNK